MLCLIVFQSLAAVTVVEKSGHPFEVALKVVSIAIKLYLQRDTSDLICNQNIWIKYLMQRNI